MFNQREYFCSFWHTIVGGVKHQGTVRNSSSYVMLLRQSINVFVSEFLK